MTQISDVIEILKERVNRYDEGWISWINPKSPIEDEYFIMAKRYGFTEGPSKRLVLMVEPRPDGPVVAFRADPSGEISSEAEEGTPVVVELENGDLVVESVTEISSRQITTSSGKKFKKSDKTGWGDETARIREDVDPVSIAAKNGREADLDDVKVGDTLMLDNSEVEEVVKITTRTVKTENYTFTHAGEGWGDQEVNVTMAC